MMSVDPSQTVEFADGDAKVSRGGLEFLKGFLSGLPPLVSFAEIAGGSGDPAGATADFAAPPGYSADSAGMELHGKAQAYQAAHPGVGYVDAVKAVGGR